MSPMPGRDDDLESRSDPATRATRDAANAAAVAVLVYLVLWLVSTQVSTFRAISPFAEDPWDAFAGFAALFLPFVAFATWIRSLGHRERVLPPTTAARIREGSGLSAGIVLIVSAMDAHAMATVEFVPDAGVPAALLTDLVTASIVGGIVAFVLTIRAEMVASRTLGSAHAVDPREPDVVDDLLHLATDLAARLGLRQPADRASSVVESFLDQSPWSPRRHRLWFGVVVAVIAGLSFVVWHGLREGPWATATAPFLVGILVADGVLAIYLVVVGPLRLLRPIELSTG
ncbi:MAG TPA: hypothetical protein VH440_01445 [Candidatus Limnocylindrales bacterium]